MDEEIENDAILYKKRHKIENMFGRMKDWRRAAMRFDRRADIFLVACALATTVLFWL
jgi:transposase